MRDLQNAIIAQRKPSRAHRRRYRNVTHSVGDSRDLHHLLTSCTRTTCAPPKIAATTDAAVPHSRFSVGHGGSLPPPASFHPINTLRDVPTTSG